MIGRSRLLARKWKYSPVTRTVKRLYFDEAVSSASHFIQSGMQGLHGVTGLPWWATFCVSTLFVKVGLFPLVRSQLLANLKLQRAMPELNLLFQLLKNRLEPLKYDDFGKKMALIKTFIRGVNACLTVHYASVAAVFAYPLTNLGFFFMFVYSLRDMVKGDMRQTLQNGGISWFTDLSQRDTTYILPVSAISLSYLAIEASLGRGPQTRLLLIFKDLLQSVVILSLPLVTYLPSGIFMYWIPSSMFAIAQSFLIRHAPFLKMLKIPIPVKPPAKIM